jgi:uncharacterized protein
MIRFSAACVLAIAALPAFSQVINISDKSSDKPVDSSYSRGIQKVTTRLKPVSMRQVQLLNSVFLERSKVNREYLMSLRNDNLLQNFYLEAGIRIERERMHESPAFVGDVKPRSEWHDVHLGWESPSCQVRGHFLGHWLSAAAYLSATQHDQELKAKADYIVSELARCQQLNGGKWVGSIPEKFFDIMAEGERWVWSPQYTLHKTLMGLYDMHVACSNAQALQVLENAADWFYEWTDKMIKDNNYGAIYNGEACGMLEVWANLYGLTGKEKYLQLMTRYSQPDLFDRLLKGEDALTNNHANASIPWAQGAARAFEVTGDEKWKKIVEAFWKNAVTDRGMFCTGGNNAGEFFIPKNQFAQFLGPRNQEHCTVYNMNRLAQYLMNWTGDAKYADYIERNLYNGTLAQQNPRTGMIAYFLPLHAGSKKVWGSETHDFWCCHGTLVQAHTQYVNYIYYEDAEGVVVGQFIPSVVNWTHGNTPVKITQTFADQSPEANPANASNQWTIDLTIESDKDLSFPVKFRRPWWAKGDVLIVVDGKQQKVTPGTDGFISVKGTWKKSFIRITMKKEVTAVPLPDLPEKVAFMDGPVVLAAVTDKEIPFHFSNGQVSSAFVPQFEHVYDRPWSWKWGYYMTKGQQQPLYFKPLFEITDEVYTVYFPVSYSK